MYLRQVSRQDFVMEDDLSAGWLDRPCKFMKKVLKKREYAYL